MALRDALLPELERELATTRRVLERAPEAHFDWRPHAKSMTLGHLATHIAQLPGHCAFVLGGAGLDLAMRGEAPRTAGSSQELLAMFDAAAAKGRAALSAASDEALGQLWTMRNGAKIIFQLPRLGAIRMLAMSHMIHHRGQLSVYLRLKDVALPSIYGPSADESA